MLARKSFDLKKALVEWKSFKIFASEMFSSNISPFSLWRSVISSRRNEYPNLCLLASMVMTISGFNTAVERAFSVLTLMLSDRRLSASHQVLEDRLVVKANDKNGTDKI